MPQHKNPTEHTEPAESDIDLLTEVESDLNTNKKHKPHPCPPHPCPPPPPWPQNCICSCICQFLEIPGIDQIIHAEFKVVEVKHIKICGEECVKLVFKIFIKFINCQGEMQVFCETFTRIFCKFPRPCCKRPPIAIFCNPPAFDFNCDWYLCYKNHCKNLLLVISKIDKNLKTIKTISFCLSSIFRVILSLCKCVFNLKVTVV